MDRYILDKRTVILRVIIPVHGRFIRITIFIDDRPFVFNPGSTFFLYCCHYFFTVIIVKNVWFFFLSFFFLSTGVELHYHYSSSKLIGVIRYTDLCFSRFGTELKKKKGDNFQVDYFCLETRCLFSKKEKYYGIIVSFEKIYSLFTCSMLFHLSNDHWIRIEFIFIVEIFLNNI